MNLRAIEDGVAKLVEAVEHLMAASGRSLAVTVAALVRARVHSPLGRVVMRVLGAISARAVFNGNLMWWISTTLAKPYGVHFDRSMFETAVSKAGGTVAGLFLGNDVPVAPLARAVVACLDPLDAQRLADRAIKYLLDTFVRNRYSAGSAPGFMCALCSAAACSAAGAVRTIEGDGARKQLGAAVRLLIDGLNALLATQAPPLTVTKVIHQAAKTYAPAATTRAGRAAAGALVAGARTVSYLPSTPGAGIVATVVSLATMARVPYADWAKAAYLPPHFQTWLRAYGLNLNQGALGKVLQTHATALHALARGDASVPLDNLIVDTVLGLKPLGLLRGALATGAGNVPSKEFCGFCDALYKGCAAVVLP